VRGAGEGVEQDAECEREDPLGDAEGESGGCAGEVRLEPHLLFQVCEDAFDHQPGGGECAFAVEIGGGARLVGGEQLGAVGGESRGVVAAPETLVGDDDRGWGAGEQIGERLVLFLVGRHDRVAERQPALVGQQHEPYPVEVAVLRGSARVSVCPTGSSGRVVTIAA
jgi:hypothetical protein